MVYVSATTFTSVKLIKYHRTNTNNTGVRYKYDHNQLCIIAYQV